MGILGAGAVGGVLAALLDRAGHDVEMTARGSNLAALQTNGLRLTGAWGDHTVPGAASDVLTGRPEVVFVTTKAQDAIAAITANRAALAGATLVIVQNGLDGIGNARRASPGSEIVGALALFAASLVSPGVVTVTGANRTYLGTDAGDTAAVSRVARLLDGVLPVDVVDDFAGAQWTKLIINQVNGLPAVTGLSVQEVIADPALRAALVAGMQEATRIGMTRIARFGTLQGLTDARLRLFARAPRRLAAAVPLSLARRMGATPNPGSTLQSIRRGQPSEIDYLNGAVVRAASAAGRTAPVNAAIVELVREVERTGRFFTPSEVVARVPLATRR